MSHGASDDELIANTHNTARSFTERRSISWVLLVGTVVWGMFGYATMPKRKDPEIPVRVAVAIASWPGANAATIEDRVTRVVENRLAQNSKIEKLESTTRAGVAVIAVTLDKKVADTAKEFDDIWLKLSSLGGLPEGVNVQFIKGLRRHVGVDADRGQPARRRCGGAAARRCDRRRAAPGAICSCRAFTKPSSSSSWSP